jgi:hypothetical protein
MAATIAEQPLARAHRPRFARIGRRFARAGPRQGRSCAFEWLRQMLMDIREQSKALPLLALLVLASALGVAVAVALAAVTMLLAA